MDPAITVVEPFGAVIGGEINALTAPLWTPWPVPVGWTFAGLAYTGVGAPDGGSTVASWMGDDPFGDPIEILFVCEEAGTGLGSHFAGLDTNYPPASVGQGPPHAKFGIDGRPVPLWSVQGHDDRAVYAGEAAGRWLWVIVHPSEASAVVVQPITLVDARSLGAELSVLPVGEVSPRLALEYPGR
jgi:hypothetical protein